MHHIYCMYGEYNLVSYKLALINTFYYSMARKFDRQITSKRFKLSRLMFIDDRVVRCIYKKSRGQIRLAIGYHRSKARY